MGEKNSYLNSNCYNSPMLHLRTLKLREIESFRQSPVVVATEQGLPVLRVPATPIYCFPALCKYVASTGLPVCLDSDSIPYTPSVKTDLAGVPLCEHVQALASFPNMVKEI